jgi:CDP-diacylglycerol--serine O-phosphatidyltransferase
MLRPVTEARAGRSRHFSMIRGFHLADLFTLANAGCGVASVFAAMTFVASADRRFFFRAAALLPLALVFDVLDGRVARWRQPGLRDGGEQSGGRAMGRELDSLADVISFGVAPAALAFAAGMRGGWDWLALIYFVVCGVSRLARYNVTAEELSAGADVVPYFEGTPIPSSVALVGVLAVAGSQGRLGPALYFGGLSLGPWQIHPLVVLFVLSGSLMISKTIRIPKL